MQFLTYVVRDTQPFPRPVEHPSPHARAESQHVAYSPLALQRYFCAVQGRINSNEERRNSPAFRVQVLARQRKDWSEVQKLLERARSYSGGNLEGLIEAPLKVMVSSHIQLSGLSLGCGCPQGSKENVRTKNTALQTTTCSLQDDGACPAMSEKMRAFYPMQCWAPRCHMKDVLS